MINELLRRRAGELFAEQLRQIQTETGRLFLWLFIVQWLVAIVAAVTLSPYAWAGTSRSVHLHVYLAVFGGLAVNSLPIGLILFRPQWPVTRHVVAASQMLWSAIFVHLSGGRIETHFHIFGSLAFLTFYRDPKVLVTATLVVAADHLLLGFLDPLSVYGIVNPEWWRFLEHAGWVLFEDIVLIVGCRRQLRDMRTLAQREAYAEQHRSHVEMEVVNRTRELEASGERYRSLLENTSALPWELNPQDGRIAYAAPRIAELAGVSHESVAPGQSFLALLHPDDQNAFQSYLLEAVTHRGSFPDSIDIRMVTHNRSTVYLRSFVAGNTGDIGSGTVSGISLDVTKQKRMELDLLQAQKLESIGHLAAGIAHEINTPTQFIGDNVRFVSSSVMDLFGRLDEAIARSKSSPALVPADIVRPFTDDDTSYLREEMPRALSQTMEGVDRIAAIVGAMKDFSHPGLEKIPCDLNRAIMSTITVARNEWKYVAEVQTHFDATLPLVSVMPSAFNQVILNLLVNAAQAIAASKHRQPEEKGLIEISTRRQDKSVQICIQDSGCGIPADIQTLIFDPFFTTKEVGKGTGQGLAISRDVIVNKHGGSIDLKSTTDVGTTFVIELPLDRAARPQAVMA